MPKTKTTYSRRCVRCKQAHYIRAHEEDIEQWMEGVSIQEALPYLSANEREMLISGICPTCWEELFGEDE